MGMRWARISISETSEGGSRPCKMRGNQNSKQAKMKKLKLLIGRPTLGCVLALCLTSKLQAQMPPPPNTNAPPGGWRTNTFDYTAFYSNNLASVSEWLHDNVTNVDGTPADSMQDLMDTQITTLSASEKFSWQQSARDEALTWATANGIPTGFTPDVGPAAVLVGREGPVPNYMAPCDLAADITLNTTNVWPGGSTGLNLTGTNTLIAMWDEASPRLTHSELASRVTELDGNTNLSDHSTAVAGMLAASGANIIRLYG
jgi:hypothetical protein